MSKLSMDAIRAALAEKNRKNNNNGESKAPAKANIVFPHWNTPMNEQTTLRFVPDADPDNPFFWRERMTIKLPFNGVVGGQYPSQKLVEVQVPCMESWGERCPITEDIRPLWQTPDENIARTYYRKVSFIYQGFVVKSAFTEEVAPENPIRRFDISKQIQKKIELAMADPDMDLPVDYTQGTDFVVRKAPQGQHADWSGSDWARKTRSLTEEEAVAIQNHGLNKLIDFLGPKPDAETLAIIMEMYRDSRAGLPFDAEKYGEHGFRAFPVRNQNQAPAGDAGQARVADTAGSTQTANTQTTQVVTQREPQAEYEEKKATSETPTSTGGQDISDIIARIRAGQ